jgi:hypothetical protein
VYNPTHHRSWEYEDGGDEKKTREEWREASSDGGQDPEGALTGGWSVCILFLEIFAH